MRCAVAPISYIAERGSAVVASGCDCNHVRVANERRRPMHGSTNRPSIRGLRAAFTLLLMLGATQVAHAAIYKCNDAKGHVAYQDHACAGVETQTRIELAPSPPPAASPEYSVSSVARNTRSSRMRDVSPQRKGRQAAAATSYECRAADGEVFYRHHGCPKSIKVDPLHAPGKNQGTRTRRGEASSSIAVSARPMSRSDACQRLAAAGSIGRAGHVHDEIVSAYDRNAGRDPCRDW